jgi:putative transposase
VVVPKKNEKLKICVDFKKLNKATQKDPYPLPFFDEILNIVVRYEAYSFLDGYLRYRYIFIAFEDRYKTTFVTNQGVFVWMVMSFGVKNGPPTF